MTVVHVGEVQSHQTSVVKAITWRVFASVITIILVLIYTGELHLAAKVGALDVIVKLVVYYVHERIWLKFRPRRRGK